MRRCLGCFEQINDGMSACPYCGFSERMSPPNARFITPGCLLSNRYSIGRVISTDSESINYIAWDSTSNLKVLIREFYPSDYVIRESGSFLSYSTPVMSGIMMRRAAESAEAIAPAAVTSIAQFLVLIYFITVAPTIQTSFLFYMVACLLSK